MASMPRYPGQPCADWIRANVIAVGLRPVEFALPEPINQGAFHCPWTLETGKSVSECSIVAFLLLILGGARYSMSTPDK